MRSCAPTASSMRAWIVLLSSLLPALPVAAAELRSIRIDRPPGDERYLQPWSVSAPMPRRMQVELDLGSDLEGAVLTLVPEVMAAAARYRVRVQFETSMAIGDEGPHVDLLDWKHCRSAWKPAAASGALTWTLPAATASESTCFPPTSAREIEAATRTALVRAGMDGADPRWLALARSVATPGEAPSYVAISKIRVRVEVVSAGAWAELTTIEFEVPMGC